MKFSISLLLTVLLCVPVSSVAQATTPLTPDEKKAKLQEAAVAFLLETYSDIGNLRLVENRISFTSELAALLWYKDQKSAAAMFGTAVGDFKQLLAMYDSQMNAFGPINADEHVGFGAFMQEPTDRSRIAKKFRTAMGVRQQIAMSIAEHEPELAYNFFHDSMNAITNAEFRKQMETSDATYEQQLISRIAETNVKQAAELGKRTLGKGFTFAHVALLKRIYAKDPAKGIEFGQAILGRLKETSQDKFGDGETADLLRFGNETLAKSKLEGGKKAVYSESELRDIAELLARAMLAPGEVYETYTAMSYADAIEKTLPSRAAQIRAKYAPKEDGREPDRTVFATGGAPPPPPPAVYRGPARTSSGAASSSGIGLGSGTGSGQSPAEKERAAREEAEREAMEGVAKLGQKDLPKEEREKIVAKAREMIAKTTGRDKKIAGLSMLAASVAKAGDKQLASEIMREAATLVNPQPKTYLDFMYSWMLASGYAVAEPDKAFPVLDDAIFRVNDLISSVVRIAEFIDVNEEVIADGEFQVGAFGGQMIRGMTGSVGMADSTITSLIDADFEKTKALTNRFERAEVRVLAKMMILRSVLGKEAKPGDAITTEDEIGEDIDIN
jgi:hypothetical protein